MKKFKISDFLLVLALAFVVFSCKKNESVLPPDTNPETKEVKQNEATWIVGDDNSKIYWLKLRIHIGHTAEQCGNKCLKFYGENYHADCRGFGNICTLESKAKVIENEDGRWSLFIVDEEMLSGLDFNFPDRSLFITNPQNNFERWLNIPEQILLIDTVLMITIIQDAWFSEEQELENE